VESKGCYINALPPAGELTFLAVLTEKELRSKRNGGVYLHLRLAHRTGELDAKVWHRPEEKARSVDRDQVVKVRGSLEQYNERPQLVVSKIRQCGPEEYRADDFCPTLEQDPEALYGYLLSYVETIQRPALRDLLRTIVEDPGIRGEIGGGARGSENPSRVSQRATGYVDKLCRQSCKYVDGQAASFRFHHFVSSA